MYSLTREQPRMGEARLGSPPRSRGSRRERRRTRTQEIHGPPECARRGEVTRGALSFVTPPYPLLASAQLESPVGAGIRLVATSAVGWPHALAVEDHRVPEHQGRQQPAALLPQGLITRLPALSLMPETESSASRVLAASKAWARKERWAPEGRRGMLYSWEISAVWDEAGSS
jgi:hypothetical protein